MIDALEADGGTLDRHFETLSPVAANQPSGSVQLANETGYPKHKVRYSLRVLEEESLIEPTDRGAITTEDAGAAVAAYRERLDELGERIGALTGDVEPVQSA